MNNDNINKTIPLNTQITQENLNLFDTHCTDYSSMLTRHISQLVHDDTRWLYPNREEDELTHYWEKLSHPRLNSYLPSSSQESLNEMFLFLNELHALDFESCKRLIDLAKKQLTQGEAFFHYSIVTTILAAVSKENMFRLMDDPTYASLITSNNIQPFLTRIMISHGNVVAKEIWDKYSFDSLIMANNIKSAQILFHIITIQDIELKKRTTRNYREHQALDDLCEKIASNMPHLSPYADDNQSCYGTLAKMAARLGLEKTIRRLCALLGLPHHDMAANSEIREEIFLTAFHFKNIKDNDFILNALADFFGSAQDINQNDIIYQLQILRLLLEIMTMPHPRTTQFKNKIEEMSEAIFCSVTEKLQLLMAAPESNLLKHGAHLINILYNAMTGKSPYFFEKVCSIFAQLVQRPVDGDGLEISNLERINFTEIMIEPSFKSTFERIKNMNGYHLYEPAFKISFAQASRPLFSSKALLAINNLYDATPTDYYENIIKDSLHQRYHYQQNNIMSRACDEIFCMNLAVIADAFLTRNEQRVAVLRAVDRKEGEFLVSSYKKGCCLWILNYALLLGQHQNAFNAIKCFQELLETHWCHDVPEHRVWTLSAKSRELQIAHIAKPLHIEYISK